MDPRFERYARTRCRALRDELLVEHLDFACGLAARYMHRREPLDDLRQVASLALVKALDRFDPSRGVPFTAFAAPTILGELRRHFRDACWVVSVPRTIRDRAQAIHASRAMLEQDLGRPPGPDEIARAAASSVDDVLTVLAAGRLAFSRATGEHVAAVEDSFAAVEARLMIADACAQLPARMRLVLYMTFVEEASQRQIARRLAVSQPHVSRLLGQALEHVRDRLVA